MSGHVVLLGDSIFDNAVYVPGEPSVIEHLRRILPRDWDATLLAIDGATNAELIEMAGRVVNNQLMKIEVRERAIELSEEEFAAHKEAYERRLNDLRNALGVDSTLARATTEADRKRVVQEGLDR